MKRFVACGHYTAVGEICPCVTAREPHIYTPAHDWLDAYSEASEALTEYPWVGKPRALKEPTAFPLMTHPQPDTAERTRLAVQSIPFALPEKRDE